MTWPMCSDWSWSTAWRPHFAHCPFPCRRLDAVLPNTIHIATASSCVPDRCIESSTRAPRPRRQRRRLEKVARQRKGNKRERKGFGSVDGVHLPGHAQITLLHFTPFLAAIAVSLPEDERREDRGKRKKRRKEGEAGKKREQELAREQVRVN